jgi:hypothetical protein
MVFGFYTAAMAGVSPEPGGLCGIKGSKYQGPPYVIDFTSVYQQGTGAIFTATISRQGDPTCKKEYTNTDDTISTQSQWDAVTKKSDFFICFSGSTFATYFCDDEDPDGYYKGDLEVVAVASYSKSNNMVTGRLIVLKLVPK